MFGPQKGAGPADMACWRRAWRRLAGLLGGDPGQPGAGAAGGCGYGLAAAWGARLLPGAAELAVIAGLPQALAGADLVITGEGQYDATSESGKVVGAVRALAAAVKSQPQPGSGERDGGQAPGEPEAGVPGWGLPRAAGGPGSGERDGGQVPGEPESGAREADGGPAAGEQGLAGRRAACRSRSWPAWRGRRRPGFAPWSWLPSRAGRRPRWPIRPLAGRGRGLLAASA